MEYVFDTGNSGIGFLSNGKKLDEQIDWNELNNAKKKKHQKEHAEATKLWTERTLTITRPIIEASNPSSDLDPGPKPPPWLYGVAAYIYTRHEHNVSIPVKSGAVYNKVNQFTSMLRICLEPNGEMTHLLDL